MDLNKILFVTRNANDELYNMALFLINNLNIKTISLKNTTADGYIFSIFNDFKEYDWIINFDEDAFIFNKKILFNLISFMDNNNYHICGMPDGGVINHRFHNPLVLNPFFNIIDNRYYRNIQIKEIDFKPELIFKSKLNISKLKYKYEFDNFEPYYKLFFYLLDIRSNFLYLPVLEHFDTLSTIICDLNNQPFLIHTWFSRHFINNKNDHRTRIMSIYDNILGDLI